MITVSATGDRAQRVAWKVRDLMAEEQTLRTTTSDILVEATEGSLRLSGRVRTNILRNLAQRLAQSAANGWQLHNDLLSDETLAMAVTTRLASDERTADANVRCEVYLGSAQLKGVVHSRKQRDAALALARSAPGITHVKDLMAVRN